MHKLIALSQTRIELVLANSFQNELRNSILENAQCLGFSPKNFTWSLAKLLNAYQVQDPTYDKNILKEIDRLNNLASVTTKYLSSSEACKIELNEMLSNLNQNDSLIIALGDYIHFVFAIVTKHKAIRGTNKTFVIHIINAGTHAYYQPFIRHPITHKRKAFFPKVTKKCAQETVLKFLITNLENTHKESHRHAYRQLYMPTSEINWVTSRTVKKYYAPFQPQTVDNCGWHGYLACLNLLAKQKIIDLDFLNSFINFAKQWAKQVSET